MSEYSSTILVLGASSDIGGEIIRTIDDGKSLIFAHYHRSAEKVEQLQREVNSRILPICADLTQEKDIAALIAEVKAYCPCPDKIVHLPAPKFTHTRFKDVTWEHFQTEIDIEIRSIVLLLQEFLPLMAKQRFGRVVFMLSSVCLGMPPKATSPYTVSKYALLGLMKTLAAEYADKAITINAVSPSMVETSFLSEMPDLLVNMVAAANPHKRNAKPEDIAPLVKFLLSQEAGFMTGVNLPITGGSVF